MEKNEEKKEVSPVQPSPLENYNNKSQWEAKAGGIEQKFNHGLPGNKNGSQVCLTLARLNDNAANYWIETLLRVSPTSSRSKTLSPFILF